MPTVDATAVTAGAALINAGLTAYPVFTVMIAAVIGIWGARKAAKAIMSLFGR